MHTLFTDCAIHNPKHIYDRRILLACPCGYKPHWGIFTAKRGYRVSSRSCKCVHVCIFMQTSVVIAFMRLFVFRIYAKYALEDACACTPAFHALYLMYMRICAYRCIAYTLRIYANHVIIESTDPEIHRKQWFRCFANTPSSRIAVLAKTLKTHSF